MTDRGPWARPPEAANPGPAVPPAAAPDHHRIPDPGDAPTDPAAGDLVPGDDNRRAGPGAAEPDPPQPAVRSEPAWWSAGGTDPWRDPNTPTEIVVRTPPPAVEPVPPLEPVGPATGTAGRLRVGLAVLVTALLVGAAAGALGGTLGYRFGSGERTAGVAGGPDAPPAPIAQRSPESLAAVADAVLPSVVTVRASGRGGTQVGSGFMITAEGHLITNDHVVGDSRTPPIVTFHDGDAMPAELVGRDPESDIAVLRVDNPEVSPVQLGDSTTLAVGDPVLAFGSPLALANTVTSGIVSAVDRTIQAGEPGEQVRYYAAIQTDAAVNQGNSGGPLVDGAGRVVGVNSVIKSLAASADEAGNIGLAFAIPISQARRVAQEIIDTGEARRTVIGAELDNQRRGGTGGVRLSSVVADGPADQAGLRSGDIVLRFDGQPLSEPADLIALVRKHSPGAVVTVEYRRGGSSVTAMVTLMADG